jgi:hypothetical protein
VPPALITSLGHQKPPVKGRVKIHDHGVEGKNPCAVKVVKMQVSAGTGLSWSKI